MRFFSAFAAFLLLLCSTALAHEMVLPEPIPYSIGCLTFPHKEGVNGFVPQSLNDWFKFHVGTDLVIHDPDGTERLLVKGDQPEKGLLAVHDWCVSIDKKKVYYAHIRKFADRKNRLYCDIFEIPAAGGVPKQITDSYNEWSPPTGVWPKDGTGNVSHIQVWNTAPCDTPEGLIFCSTRNGVKSPEYGHAAHQLFRMKHDGSEVEKIGHLNLGGALHPHYWKGRVYFSSGEHQGRRAGGWGIWSIKPDGTDWQPEWSDIPPSYSSGTHNSTHSSHGTLLVDRYYDNNVFGWIIAVPPFEATRFGPPTPFGNPLAGKNPVIWAGWDVRHRSVQSGNFAQFPFQRRGAFGLLPWADERDGSTEDADGNNRGKVGMPWGAPGNGVLLTWTSDNNVMNDLDICLVPDAGVKHYPPPDGPLPSDKPLDYMVRVVAKPGRHEWFGKAIASYEEIYGSQPPAMTSSPVATELPDGSPYAIVGSSSVDHPEIVDKQNKVITFNPESVEWLRVLHTNPTQSLQVGAAQPGQNGGGTEGFSSAINERVGSYPLIPIKKYVDANGKIAHQGPNPPPGLTRLMGPDGKPDSSFLAQIPADQTFTFQLLNAKGEAIFEGTADTWHQLRPQERRTDCRGCHNHWQPDQFDITDTAAYRPDYPLLKLDKVRFVEYHRDIKEIDERLQLGIGQTPWYVPETKSTNPNWLAYGSQKNPLLNDARLLAEPASRRLIEAWQDTGMIGAVPFQVGNVIGPLITPESGNGPYADTLPPTLCLKTYADRSLIGACDPQSGLKDGSLSIKSTEPMCGRAAGAELADLATRDGDVWTLPGEPKGTMTVSIRDNQRALGPNGKLWSEEGNITRIVRTIRPFVL